MQDAVAKTARDGGLAIVGPNCLGVTNNVDGMMLHMLYAREALRGVGRSGVAFVGQSGGLLGHFQRAADGRGIAAVLCHLDRQRGRPRVHRLHRIPRRRSLDPRDRALYRAGPAAAGIPRRHPARRAAGKPVVLMQAGRSAKARKAAQSHTGALVGDYATMRTQVEDAGAIVVTTMDEMMDLVEILVRFPKPPTKGPGILTASGAYRRPDQRFRRGRRLRVSRSSSRPR